MKIFMATFHALDCLLYHIDHTSFVDSCHKSLRGTLEFFTYSCYKKNLNGNKRVK